MARMEEVESRRMEEEWNTVDCPAIVQLFVNKQREFARCIMAATSQDEAMGAVMKLQGNWDRRKTKHDTEERSLHEAGQAVYVAIQNALSDRMAEAEWKEAAKQFGTYMQTLCMMMDALECDVDVANYPKVMYEAEREKEPEPDEQQNEVSAQEPIQSTEQGDQQRIRMETEQQQTIVAGHDSSGEGIHAIVHERTWVE